MIEFHSIDEHKTAFAAALAAVPAALRQVYRRVARCFRITSELAPGLFVVGGEVALTPAAAAANGAASMSATGTGVSLAEALTACLGETAELLSQFERPGDIAELRPFADVAPGEMVGTSGWIGSAFSVFHGSTVEANASLAWSRAHSLPVGSIVSVPSDYCFRRDPRQRLLDPVGALSSGCAAGPSLEAAAARAILELIERDAAALWWYGGRPPCPVQGPALVAGDELLVTLRQGLALRPTTFLDLTTDLGIPVMAAVSVDPDGRGLACGLGARLDPVDALSAAIRELCQMELSAPLALMKRQARGEAALNASDRRHLQRTAFDTRGCALLTATSTLSATEVGRNVTGHKLILGPPLPDPGALFARLHVAGIRLLTLDLSRADIGVPVMRALSPDLQPFVSAPLTDRLSAAIARYGGGALHTTGAPLI